MITADLKSEIAKLPDLPSADLKRRWEDLYGDPPPSRIGRALMVRAVAYRMQEQVLGGLRSVMRRRLDRTKQEIEADRTPLAPSPTIKPGTRLLREWHGVTHEVIVLEQGVQYRGKTWASLSTVAREITGTRWSGPRFFGLKGRRNGGK